MNTKWYDFGYMTDHSHLHLIKSVVFKCQSRERLHSHKYKQGRSQVYIVFRVDKLYIYRDFFKIEFKCVLTYEINELSTWHIFIAEGFLRVFTRANIGYWITEPKKTWIIWFFSELFGFLEIFEFFGAISFFQTYLKFFGIYTELLEFFWIT